MPMRACSRAAGRGFQTSHLCDQREPGAHRPLGVVLVRPRPTEIGDHAVAQELGDVAVEARDHLRAGRLIGAHDLAQVLGIEPGRQLCRAHQVAEQHRRRSASADAVRAWRPSDEYAGAESFRSAAIASSSLLRCPSAETPSSFRSSPVSVRRRSPSMAFATNASGVLLQPLLG